MFPALSEGGSITVPLHGHAVKEDVSQEWVDLGLPSGTLWAKCNVGASAPEDYGDYFAWGETEPKDYYDWSTYKWCNGSETTMTKYCDKSYYGNDGFVDNKTELDPEDDAAYVNWGPSWRIPTVEQQQELYNNCTSVWTQLNGVNGRLFTGPNGNTMFLPAAEGRFDESLYPDDGFYWSSTLSSTHPYCAYFRGFHSGKVWDGGSYRFHGFTVRAVRVPAPCVTVSVAEVDFGDVLLGNSPTQILEIDNSSSFPQTVTVKVIPPFSIAHNESSMSSLTVEVAPNSCYPVTIIFQALSEGDYLGTATFTSNAIEGGSITVPLHGHAVKEGNHEWVDLGLPSGTLWATCNVGASSPEGYGDYFAWGETEPKDYYGSLNYKWWYDPGPGSDPFFTKYYTGNSSFDGIVDNKTELDPEDDAAYVNWGPLWRMPSREQMDELLNECSWEWTTRNGVNGELVTGPNGKTLFFPAAGYRENDEVKWVGERGMYWSHTLGTTDVCAYWLYFKSDMKYCDIMVRYGGFSVRAVRVSQKNESLKLPKREELSIDKTVLLDILNGKGSIESCTEAVDRLLRE